MEIMVRRDFGKEKLTSDLDWINPGLERVRGFAALPGPRSGLALSNGLCGTGLAAKLKVLEFGFLLALLVRFEMNSEVFGD